MAIFRTLFSWLRKKPPRLQSPQAEARREQRLERRRARTAPEAPEARPAEPASDANFPSFRTSAIDRPARRSQTSRLTRARLLLRDIFTPAQPVTERSRFAGRLGVLARLIEILEEQRSHVVIYGERGIGKTSLVHILAEIARDSRYLVIYESCGAQSRFEEIFRTILSEVPQLYLRDVDPAQLTGETVPSLAERLPEHFDARQLGELCAQITGTRVIIVLDEYDRADNPEFRQSVAELIKNLSDRAARVQLVLAGVASNLQELVGYIPSVRRNIIGLPMPRLTSAEIRALIKIGEDATGVQFDEDAIGAIDSLSNGSPYLVRLLSHHASMIALDDERMAITLADVWAALDKIVEEAASRIDKRLIATVEPRLDAARRELIGAAARAASTPDGWFAPEDAVSLLEPRGSMERMVGELNELTAAGVLERGAEAPSARYRFREEPLPTYLWMRIARDRLAADISPAKEPTRSVAS